MCWIKGNNYVLPSTCVKPWAESRPYQKGIWPILQVRNQGEVICPKSTTSKWKSTTSIWLINEVICPKSTTSKRLLLTFKILFLSTPLYSWTKGLNNGLVFSSLFSRWVMSLCDLMDCSPPGSSVHGISQARILEFVAISFSRASSQPRALTLVSWVSCIGRQIPYHWATREARIMGSASVQKQSLLITGSGAMLLPNP